MVDHPLVYDRLLEVFLHDWALVTHWQLDNRRKKELTHGH
jgi:hypothetical protein